MQARIIVVPYDSGIRDVRMGAGPRRLAAPIRDALRRAGHEVISEEVDVPERGASGELAFTLDVLKALADCVAAARRSGALAIVLAGNCLSSLGTVKGLHKSGASGVGVVWFDAHGDFNTPETTRSGFLDGMALAMLTGRCWSGLTARDFATVGDHCVVLVGARDLDPKEAMLLDDSRVDRVPASADGATILARARKLTPRLEQIYLHVDLDVLDD